MSFLRGVNGPGRPGHLRPVVGAAWGSIKYDPAALNAKHTICITHWLKSNCKRAGDLSRHFRAEGLCYESQELSELKGLLHEE